MIIYLSGVEQPTNARLAQEGGARNVAISFSGLRPRLPKKKPWLISERIEAERVLVTGGGAATKKMSDEEFAGYVCDLSDFVQNNLDDITLFIEPDDERFPVEVRRDLMVLGDRYARVWREDMGPAEIDRMAEQYGVVAVKAETMRNSPALLARLNPLKNRYGVRWHVLDGARTEELMTGRFDSAATVAWLSPMKYGETLVWDGVRMQRYPARMKDTSRPRHKNQFSQAGFNAERILEGDHEELTRFTVWSFQRLEDHVSKRKPPLDPPFSVIEGGLSTSPTSQSDEGPSELAVADADNSPAVVRNGIRTPTVRSEGRTTLPVVGFTTKTEVELDADGNKIITERHLLKNSNVPLRQCDTCHVAATCPAFNPGAECAFELPVEIKTKDQLSAAMSAVLEMQAQRVAFMRFQEELNGGYSDPNVSQEMDRFFKMVESLKKVEDNREFIRFQVESRTQGGVLSALFGEQAKKVNELPQPVDSSRVIDGLLDS